MQSKLLQLPDAKPQDYGEQVTTSSSLLRGTYRSAEGIEAHVVPGEGAHVQVWILGSSGGESAQVAGRNGLRFAANYHVSPATVLEAADGYRAAFQPSAELAGRTSASRPMSWSPVTKPQRGNWHPATAYGCTASAAVTGAIAVPDAGAGPCPHLEPESNGRWWPTASTPSSSGSARQVAGQLEQLRDATGADELIITTITHNHADRVRSYQLLAEEWSRR